MNLSKSNGTSMTNLSEQQLEQLSAYLDGELPDHERIAVEQQIQVNPALAAELREMQTMLAMLHAVPAIQPPRTFTLDQAVYGRQRRAGFSWMRWATALGALVLMLTVGLTLAQQGGSETAQTAPSAGNADELAMQVAPAEEPASASRSAAESAAAATEAPAAVAPTEAAAMAFSSATGEPVGGAPPAPESAADQARKTIEATPSIQVYLLDPQADPAQPFPPAGSVGGSVESGQTPVDLTTETLPLAGDTLALPLQDSDTSSPDTRDLEQQQPLPEPQAPEVSGVAADESPSLWLLFLAAALIGVVATIVVTQALRRLE